MTAKRPMQIRPCLVLALAATACARTDLSSSLEDYRPPQDGGVVTHVGGDGGGGSTVPATVTLSGTVVDFDNQKPINSAQVSVGDSFATTDANGAYSLTVGTDHAFSFSVTAAGYLTYADQPAQLTANATWQTRVPTMQLASSFWTGVSDYDPTLGLIGVQVIATGSCRSVAGAKVHVAGGGAPIAVYFASKQLSRAVHEAQDGERPTAIVYNVPITKKMVVTVDGGSCTPAPFPVTYEGAQWGNVVTADAGNSIVWVRLFLK